MKKWRKETKRQWNRSNNLHLSICSSSKEKNKFWNEDLEGQKSSSFKYRRMTKNSLRAHSRRRIDTTKESTNPLRSQSKKITLWRQQSKA